MDIGTEMQHLKSLPEIRLENSIGSIRYPNYIVDELKYISLKDIIPNSPTKCKRAGFDICIRNQLVKQAASAYLQSAAVILTSRNQNCLVRFWRRLAFRASLRSYWHNCVRNPFQACASPIYQLFVCLLNRIDCV